MAEILLLLIFVVAPLAASAIGGMLMGSLVKQSGRVAIVAASALSPFLLMGIGGVCISYMAARSDAGGAFFFGIAVVILGAIMSAPGMLVGYLVARYLRLCK